MNLLRSIGSELLGLFVDDWAFAILVIVWVLLFALLGPRLPHTAAIGAVFFTGLAALTLIFAWRKAR